MGGKRRAQPSGSAQGKSPSLRTRVGPSEDTLQRVLPLLLERVEPEGGAQCFNVCKSWRRELVARGFCSKTVQLCSALAEGGDAGRLGQDALRLLRASTAEIERAMCLDLAAFLQRTGGRGGNLHLWLQAASQEPDASFLSRGAASTAEALGLRLVLWVGKPQGSCALEVGEDGDEDLVRNEECMPVGHSDSVYTVDFSPAAQRFVSGSDDKLVKIWNAETGAVVRTLTGHFDTVNWVHFSPDGKRVVSGSDDKLVKIWDVETGAEVYTLAGHSEEVFWVAFSPDGKRVLSGSSDELVKIWDVETRAEVCTLIGHLSSVYTVAFSPDGKRVVSGSADELVKIWDVETGAEVWSSTSGVHDCTGGCVCTMAVGEDGVEDLVRNPECMLVGHSDSVYSVNFSPDGKSVVSGSADNLVKIWDVETGAEVCTLRGHSDCVTRVQFSEDGVQVVSGSGDNTVRFWDVASDRQVRQLEGRLFAFVEGPSREHTRGRYVITANGDTLLIYDSAQEEQHAGDGAAAAPVAFFKAPRPILSVYCFGAAIFVGCSAGAVCVLSAPFLIA